MSRPYHKKKLEYWNNRKMVQEPKDTQASFDTTAGFDGSTHFSAVAACGGGVPNQNIVRSSGTGALIDANAFRNLRSGIIPFEDIDGYYSVSTAIDLAVRAYFNVALVRNAINTMVDFSVSDIHIDSTDKNVKRFIRTWLKAARIKELSRQFYLEYYRSSNVFLYKYSGKIGEKEYAALTSLDVLEESTAKKVKEAVAARTKYATPKIPIKFALLNPSQVYLQKGAMASNGYVKMLSTYELFRLKNPQTEEERQIFESLPEPMKQAIKKGGAFRYIYAPLEQDRLFTAFYRKQDYEPLAIPMVFPILNDVEWKLELKKMDMSLSKTIEQVILLVTTGRPADQYNKASSSQNQTMLQELFKNQTLGRVMVADYTTKAEWKIPDLKEILGEAKYARVDKDIKEGLQYLFFGDEKFANASVKVQMLAQGLQEGRNAFLDFLNKQIDEICGVMKFKAGARAYLDKINMEDASVMSRLYIQMATLGLLTPDELNHAIETGVLPSNYDSLRHQEEWKKQRDEGLYQPMLGGSGDTSSDSAGEGPNGRPSGTGKPMPNKKVGKIGKSKASLDIREKYQIGYVAMADNVMKMGAFRMVVADELRNKYGLKNLNEAQDALSYTLASNIIMNSEKSLMENEKQWKKVAKAAIENPPMLTPEMTEELTDISATFEVNTWVATIIHKSQV